jgi:hypothetical protein
MVKLGLMHAMLIDMALGEERRRKPRVSDAFVQSISPFDTGIFLLRLMDHIGMIDEDQRAWLRRDEELRRTGRDSLL